MFKKFYDAWWFLNNHAMFQDEYENSHFLECLDVYVAKVNPDTCSIDDDESLNTKTEVWLEIGNYDKNCRWHDVDLDCGGDTYEKAIIQLANNVLEQYGRGKDRIKISSFMNA